MIYLELPAHSEPCHSITVYNGARYIEEHLVSRTRGPDKLDVTKYADLEDARFEHSAADVRGKKQPPQYRAIARIDGIWFPYSIESDNWGLPAIVSEAITDPHPTEGEHVEEQDSEPVKPKKKKTDESR